MPDKPRRGWGVKFAEAFRGISLGAAGERSFRVHIAVAAMVVAAATVLKCDYVEWCLLVGCIGGVMALELVNSALERLFHGLDDAAKGRITGCLDIAAGAVLVGSITAAVIGTVVLGRRAIL